MGGLRRVLLGFLMLGLWLFAAPTLAEEPESCPFELPGDNLEWKEVAPGVAQASLNLRDLGRKQAKVRIHIVRIDLSRPELQAAGLRPPGRSHKMETVQKACDGDERSCLVLINGDYFGRVEQWVVPLGLFVEDGQMAQFSGNSISLLVLEDGRALIGPVQPSMELCRNETCVGIDLTNQKAPRNGLSLYSGRIVEHLATQRGCSAVVFEVLGAPGVNRPASLKVRKVVDPRKSQAVAKDEVVLVACGTQQAQVEGSAEGDVWQWKTRLQPLEDVVSQVVSGGPQVLTHGEVTASASEDDANFRRTRYVLRRHPRTAVAVSEDGRTLYFLVAEGRMKNSWGLTGMETGCLFQDLGASDALLLDGGGSSALMVKGKLQNEPHATRGRTGRGLGNALGIIQTPLSTSVSEESTFPGPDSSSSQ